MNLRYVVARLIPDLVRDEPINVGVILQSDKWVASKFIERIPKDWELPSDLEADVAPKLDAIWRERLMGPPETIYVAELRSQQKVAHTDRTFLEWLCSTHTRHLQLSEIREADIQVQDAFDFETFLHRLYGLFVAPKPRPREPLVKSRLHTAVKQEFVRLRFPITHQIRERDVIVGTFPRQ